MLSGETIICAAPNPWESPWHNRHQIMSRLARQNSVVYMAPRPYLRALLRNPRQLFEKGTRWREVLPNLHVYRPPAWAPVSGQQPLRDIFATWRRRDLARRLHALGGTDPILWLVSPDQGDMIGQWHEKLVVYHVVDDYTAYEADTAGAVRLAWLRRLDEKMTRRANLVICTDESLCRRKQALNPHCAFVPNGVAWHAFQNALTEPLPPLFVHLPRPVIGYIGVINDKIDLALLRQVAAAFPHGTLLLVGPEQLRVHTAEWPALQLPNVRFLGGQPVDQVSHFMKGCDVALMPYRLNAWTESINPLKMYEYLACGLPVVSTPIPAARTFAEALYNAPAERFVAAIRQALAEDSPAKHAQRRELVRPHSWDHRVEEISRHLQAVLASVQEKKQGCKKTKK